MHHQNIYVRGSGEDSQSNVQIKNAAKGFLDGYFSTHERREKTKSAYRLDIGQFALFVGESTLLSSLSGTMIEQWSASLRQRGYSPSSIRRKIVALKVFCSYWVRRKALKESPFWRVKLSYGRIEQLPRTLTEAEMRALLLEARRNHVVRVGEVERGNQSTPESFKNYRSLRDLTLVELLFATGIRVGEVSALDLDDFNLDECVFKIKGKGGLNRLAYVVDQHAVCIVKDYVSNRRNLETSSQAMFINPLRERLSTQGIANVVTKFRLAAKIDRPVTPHMFRHTVATLLLRNGVDIRVVQDFLGHTSIVTTQRYTHIAKDHLIGILGTCHPSIRLRSK